MKAPLQGVLVLDLTRVLAGPLAGMMLADFGARVIKIERPNGGDETRCSLPQQGGESGYYMAYNRNKEGITLDLKKERDRQIFISMIKKCDIIIENFRPQTMEKLGLGYDELKKHNPKLIYGAISGFGHQGDRHMEPGYDIIAQAQSGMMATTGWPNGFPTRTGAALTDTLAGLTLAFSLVTALRNRDLNNMGCKIDISLLDCATQALAALNVYPLMNAPEPRREGNRYPPSCPFNSFQAADGLFVIGASNNKLWEAICHCMEQPELITDPKFKDNTQRVKHHELIKNVIEQWAKDKTVQQVVQKLKAYHVPADSIRSLNQNLKDPTLIQRNMIISMNHPTAGKILTTGNAARLDCWTIKEVKPSPTLGQHNQQILDEFKPREF